MSTNLRHFIITLIAMTVFCVAHSLVLNPKVSIQNAGVILAIVSSVGIVLYAMAFILV